MNVATWYLAQGSPRPIEFINRDGDRMWIGMDPKHPNDVTSVFVSDALMQEIYFVHMEIDIPRGEVHYFKVLCQASSPIDEVTIEIKMTMTQADKEKMQNRMRHVAGFRAHPLPEWADYLRLKALELIDAVEPDIEQHQVHS